MAGRELLGADEGTEAGTVPALGKSRSRVLAVLRDVGEPLGVTAVAERVGLHANTARFHLDALVEAGVVDRASEERELPGRPRALYTARPIAGAGRRSYRLLAEILASYVAAETPRPAQAARDAGWAWGRYLTDPLPPFRRIDADTATERLVGTLGEIGFAPEPATTGERGRQVLLHHCPFREAAEEHPEVVCAVHLGLMQGILAEIDAPLDTERLDPFVGPSLCVAHLAARETTEPDGTGHPG